MTEANVTRMLGRWLLAAIIASLVVADACAEGAPRPVDVELVMAVDSSASISNDMLVFQLDGHASAFRDRATVDAILSRPGAAVAVTVIGWSSPGAVDILVPWMVIASREDAARFAAAIDAAPHEGIAGTTAVGNAIEKATLLFGAGGVMGRRRIIDITSNGFSNAGISPETTRDAAVAQGITINALVILDEYTWLQGYYRDSVIGGPGAFVRVAQGEEDFAAALRDKLIEEIASAEPR
jgi:Ca-activated chloride channel homolog